MALTATELAALTAELEALAKAGANVSELRKNLANLSNTDLEEFLKSLGKITTANKDLAEAIQAQTVSNKASVSSIQARVKALKAEAVAANNTELQKQKLIKLKEAELELTKAQVLTNEASAKSIVEQELALRSLNKEMDTTKKATEDLMSGFGDLLSGNLASGLKKVGKGLVDALGEGGGPSLVGKFNKQLSGLVQGVAGGSKGAIAALGGLAAAFAAFGIVAFITKQILTLAITVENLSREIQKTTGLSRQFTNEIMANGEAVRAFDPQMKNLGETTMALSKTFTDFSMMNRQVAADVATTLTPLTAMGVAANDLAKGMQLATKSMGQTGQQAAQTQLDLEALARDIGVAPAEMAANFASAGPQLAKLGRDGVRAFKDLAIASKITGIEMGRLLTITEKFDTFEGAAEQAGKLNAALGGNFVNAMELMTATDPVERFSMMRDSILDAGLAFDDMSYYQRKFYADAMGLQDVSELALVMSGNMQDLNSEIGKNSADYEDAAKRARDFQSVQEELKNALHALIPVIQPVAEGIGSFASGFADFVTTYKEEIKVFMGGLVIGLGLLGGALAATAGGVVAVVGAITALISVFTTLAFTVFRKRNSPTIAEMPEYLSTENEKLTSSTNTLTAANQHSTESFEQRGSAMSSVPVERTGAPIYATSTTMGDTVNSVAKTVNQNASTTPTIVELIMDGKKMGQAMIAPEVRNAAMGAN
jgi:hypothetical protein